MKRTIGCLLTFLLLLLLVACDSGRRERMEALLGRADSLNRAYIPMTGGLDTMLLEATKYYDRHGTANEQLRAHYLLGCAYRDMGEAPAALSAYHDAVERVDTTDADCNFALLARVHGQMAALFEDYAMPRNQLDEERVAYRYAMIAKDTVAALAFLNMHASCYDWLGIDDSVIYYSEEACRRYMEIGDTLFANTVLGPAIAAYLRRKDYAKAKEYLDRLAYHSTLTGNEPFGDKNQYLLYYDKGVYYSAMHQYDSAYTAYRKLISDGETPNNLLLGYHGLYQLFRERGMADSAFKYADIHTQFNDTFVGRLEQSKLQAVQSLYNYTRHQQIAEYESARSVRLQLAIWVGGLMAFSLVLLLLFVIYVLHVRVKARLHRMASCYAMDMLSYQETSSKLQLLRSQKNEDTELIKRLESELNVLRQTLASQQADHKDPKEWGLLDTLLNSPIVIRFHKQATIGATVTDVEWNELRQLVNKLMPHFMYTITTGNKYKLGPRETNVCILEKLRFSSSEQAALLEVTKGAISNIHRRLSKNLFDQQPSAKEFSMIIQSLPY